MNKKTTITNQERILEVLQNANRLEKDVDHLLKKLNYVPAKRGVCDLHLSAKLSILERTMKQTLARYEYLKSTTP